MLDEVPAPTVPNTGLVLTVWVAEPDFLLEYCT